MPHRRLRIACASLLHVTVSSIGLVGLLLVSDARGAEPDLGVPASALEPVPGAGGPSSEPQPPPATRITFEDAVHRAIARNPTIAEAFAEVQRADALVQEARAGWYPTLSASGSYIRLDERRPPHGPPALLQDQLYGSLTLTVPLVAPQGWTAQRHAEDNRHIDELSAADVRRLVAQSTGNAFIAVIAQRLQLRSNDTAIANSKAHADYAHTRLMGGIGRSIDDVRSQQDLASVRAQRQVYLTGLARAREALGVLVGANEPLDAVEAIDFGALPSLAGALDDATANRPDVEGQRARIAAAETQRKDVWAYYAPYLSVVASPFAQRGQVVLPHLGWQAALLLTLPLYDGGLRSGIAHERDVDVVEAKLGLDGTLREARSEVRVAFESILHADAALESARSAALLAKQALELANVAYRAGATTNLEVLDAARQARDADSAAAAAGDVSRRARLDLLASSARFP